MHQIIDMNLLRHFLCLAEIMLQDNDVLAQSLCRMGIFLRMTQYLLRLFCVSYEADDGQVQSVLSVEFFQAMNHAGAQQARSSRNADGLVSQLFVKRKAFGKVFPVFQFYFVMFHFFSIFIRNRKSAGSHVPLPWHGTQRNRLVL